MKFSYVHVLADILIDMILVGNNCPPQVVCLYLQLRLHSCTLHMVSLPFLTPRFRSSLQHYTNNLQVF